LHSWWQFDAENVLLHEITKGRKSYAVRKFVHDLTQVKILHGNKRAREYPAQRKPKPKRQGSASPRKRASPSSSRPKKAKSSSASPAASHLQPQKIWTRAQREVEAMAKMAQEAEAAAVASVGLRRSMRERMPTRKLLE
jgi:hypothetical protein